MAMMRSFILRVRWPIGRVNGLKFEELEKESIVRLFPGLHCLNERENRVHFFGEFSTVEVAQSFGKLRSLRRRYFQAEALFVKLASEKFSSDTVCRVSSPLFPCKAMKWF